VPAQRHDLGATKGKGQDAHDISAFLLDCCPRSR
jgi:hypothetical protein